jgi:hypothetical protein
VDNYSIGCATPSLASKLTSCISHPRKRCKRFVCSETLETPVTPAGVSIVASCLFETTRSSAASVRPQPYRPCQF